MRAMTVKTGATLAAAALMITMGLAGAANAQPGAGGGPGGGQGFGDGMGPGGPGGRGPGGPGGPGRMGGPLGGLLALHPDVPFQALNLTDAQREQVRAIMQGHHAEGRALAEKAGVAMDGPSQGHRRHRRRGRRRAARAGRRRGDRGGRGAPGQGAGGGVRHPHARTAGRGQQAAGPAPAADGADEAARRAAPPAASAAEAAAAGPVLTW